MYPVPADMTWHQRCELAIKPEYAYKHKDCRMAPPKGANISETLHFDIKLLEVYSRDDVRVVGQREDIYKTIMQRSDLWETPRELYDVGNAAMLCLQHAINARLTLHQMPLMPSFVCHVKKWRWLLRYEPSVCALLITASDHTLPAMLLCMLYHVCFCVGSDKTVLGSDKTVLGSDKTGNCSVGVQVEVSCSARLPSSSGRQMDTTPYFTAPSLKFTMGSGAAPSGTHPPCIPRLLLSEPCAACAV